MGERKKPFRGYRGFICLFIGSLLYRYTADEKTGL